MAKMAMLCPWCHHVVPARTTCPCRKVGRDRKAEADRRKREPWRGRYASSKARDAKQVAMERTKGRCSMCGAQVAEQVQGRWMARGGEVHHVIPLRDGGTDDPSNLTLMCLSCHRTLDASLRRGEGSNPE